MKKIGIGIITCNREEMLKKCFYSILADSYDHIVVVNDGKELYEDSSKAIISSVDSFIQHDSNKSVCISKNDAFKALIKLNSDYIFLIEDDLYLKGHFDKNTVFEKYIKASEVSKLQHFMFGYHGFGNKKDNKPIARLITDYGEDVKIAFNYNCVGAFTFYTKELLEKVGLMDERFNSNCWEHVDHSYQIVKRGFLPAYWYWPDLADSYNYIGDSDENLSNSSIRKSEDFMINLRNKAFEFKQKNNYYPTEVPDSSAEFVVEHLKRIKNSVI